jgi:transcriptional regulator GlxA family with amidase domain
MSERHLLRGFQAEVGVTPARYVAAARVAAARRELEDTDEPVAAIAAAVGFGTAESMRRTFVRDLGTPPDDYRRRFARQPDHRKDHTR